MKRFHFIAEKGVFLQIRCEDNRQIGVPCMDLLGDFKTVGFVFACIDIQNNRSVLWDWIA